MNSVGGSQEGLRRLDALAQVGLRLARSSPSGRVLLAQLALGLDPRLVPRPWGDELLDEMDAARATTTSEPLTRRELERSLRDAWRTKPTEELNDLDPEPVAVTPTSQVHRAVHEGTPVAVKVQRPGLARNVRQDLALLDSLVAPASAAFPALDARGVLREIGEQVRAEFDLEHEAANARRLSRALRDDSRLHVPAPVTRLATEDVLVREWIDGTPPDDPTLTDATRDATAAALTHFVLGTAPARIMNAGLTTHDVLVQDDGTVAILDHGTCCDVDPTRLPPTIDAVTALVANDPDTLATALHTLGWLSPTHAGDALALARDVLGDFIAPGPVTLDVDTVREAGLRLIPRQRDALALIRQGSPAPSDIWPLRGVAQLYSTIARIGARGDFADLTLAALTSRPTSERPH